MPWTIYAQERRVVRRLEELCRQNGLRVIWTKVNPFDGVVAFAYRKWLVLKETATIEVSVHQIDQLETVIRIGAVDRRILPGDSERFQKLLFDIQSESKRGVLP